MQSTTENWYVRRGHKYFFYEYELSIKPHGQELEPLSFFTESRQEQRTTEHILPQHPKTGDKCWWQVFTEEEHVSLLHSLGNLVLTYDNSVYGNKCFSAKRGKPLGPGVPVIKCYAQAALRQEQLLTQYKKWTPETIKMRQKELTDWALRRWAVASPGAAMVTEDIDIEAEGSDEDELALATDFESPHIHLGSVEPDTEAHHHFGEPEPGGRPSKSHESPEAAVLARMLASARTGNMHGIADPDLIQKVYDGLISLGYQPVAPSVRKPGRKPEPYIRWIVGGEGAAKASLNTASLGFGRRDDIAKVAGLPGAKVKSDYVLFPILTPEGVEQALAAARAVL